MWKERSRIRSVQMDNLRGLLGIRMDNPKCTNKGIMQQCKGVDERIDECSLLVQPYGEKGK